MSSRELEARRLALKNRKEAPARLTLVVRISWSDPPFWRPEDKSLPIRMPGETWKEAYEYEKRYGTWKERNKNRKRRRGFFAKLGQLIYDQI